MTQPDPVILLERSIAAKLSTLRARVRLFADEFKAAGNATQRSQILVGHSASQYQLDQGSIGDYLVGWELADFEIRCSTADLKNHQQCLGYMTDAMSLLWGYQPYENIRPLQPQRYAPVGYDAPSGEWIYSAVIRAWIMRPCDEYEATEEQEPITGVIIGIWRDGMVLQRSIETPILPSFP